MLDTARQAAETLDSGAGGWGASLHGQLAGLESRYGCLLYTSPSPRDS